MQCPMSICTVAAVPAARVGGAQLRQRRAHSLYAHALWGGACMYSLEQHQRLNRKRSSENHAMQWGMVRELRGSTK